MSKQRRILSSLGRKKQYKQRQRPQSGNTDDVNEDKSTENDEIEPKAKAAKRNFQSISLENTSTMRSISIESSQETPFTYGCMNYRTEKLQKSSYVSVTAEESTDISVSKKKW